MYRQTSSQLKEAVFFLFIHLGFYVTFNTVQVISRWVVGRTEETSTYSSLGFCKLSTNGKQLPAFPHEAMPGIEPRPQTWEARVLPLCHHGPQEAVSRMIQLLHTYLSYGYRIKIGSDEFKISQFVDDTTLLMDGSESSLQYTMNVLEVFGSLSGLKMNLSKTKVI